MNHLNPASLPNPVDTLEARFALRITARLSEHSENIGGDLTERLRFARERALQTARLARTQQVQQAVVQHAGRAGAAAILGGGEHDSSRWWLRLAAVVPLVALVCGLVLIQKMQTASQIAVAAEVDAALLSDDLPPSAYSDAGFVEFLKTPPRQ